jgi:hypothetical protein
LGFDSPTPDDPAHWVSIGFTPRRKSAVERMLDAAPSANENNDKEVKIGKIHVAITHLMAEARVPQAAMSETAKALLHTLNNPLPEDRKLFREADG